MPTGRLEKHKNGKWYIHWREGRRSRRKSTRQTDFRKAEIAMAAWIDSPTGQPPLGSELTFAEAWTFFIESRSAKLADPTRYITIGRHLTAAFNRYAVIEIRQSHIERFAAARARGQIGARAAPGTIWFEIGILIAAINFATRKGLIAREQRPKIERPTPPEPRDRWITETEAYALLTALPRAERLSRLERFLWLALETAARKRVIETLTWSQVDFETRVIHYHRSGDARTKKRRPSVPISDALLPILWRAFEERESELVLDNDIKLNDSLHRLAAKVNLKGVTPHVLRHTAATWMARRGVPMWQVAGVLGNTLAMTERVYAKHCPEGLLEAVNKIGGGSKDPTKSLLALSKSVGKTPPMLIAQGTAEAEQGKSSEAAKSSAKIAIQVDRPQRALPQPLRSRRDPARGPGGRLVSTAVRKRSQR